MLFFALLLEEAATVLLACKDVGIMSDRLKAAGLNVSIVVDMVRAPPGREAQKGRGVVIEMVQKGSNISSHRGSDNRVTSELRPSREHGE